MYRVSTSESANHCLSARATNSGPLSERMNAGAPRCSNKRSRVPITYSAVMDRTEDGRRLKMMPVVDEYTRECFAIEVERSITAEYVIGTLERLFEQRGAPAFIRSDNGPEFVARALKQWLALSEVETLYIEPGSPWENAYAESFIGRFGDELLKREAFADLIEAKI